MGGLRFFDLLQVVLLSVLGTCKNLLQIPLQHVGISKNMGSPQKPKNYLESKGSRPEWVKGPRGYNLYARLETLNECRNSPGLRVWVRVSGPGYIGFRV